MLQNCFSNLLFTYGDFSINSKNSLPLKNNIENLDHPKEQETIKGIINVENNDCNKAIYLFNLETYHKLDVYINNKKINILRDINNNKIYYIFEKCGYYNFEIVFYDKIINLEKFFEKCNNIIFLDLSNFDTSNVTNMASMFAKCYKLKEIKGLNKFNTKNVTNISGMFGGCYELEYLDLSNFDTSNVTNMKGMFWECNKLKEIKGLNKFNTKNVTYFWNVRKMF